MDFHRIQASGSPLLCSWRNGRSEANIYIYIYLYIYLFIYLFIYLYTVAKKLCFLCLTENLKWVVLLMYGHFHGKSHGKWSCLMINDQI